MRWQQAEKNAARGGFLDRRGSPLAVLDPNKAENGVDARAGGGGREEEDEDEKNGGKWKLHADGFWEWKVVAEKEEQEKEEISGGRSFIRKRQVLGFKKLSRPRQWKLMLCNETTSIKVAILFREWSLLKFCLEFIIQLLFLNRMDASLKFNADVCK